jgi:hypothetical protein
VKTSTRTLRLIAATAAALVLMTAVAQARPMASAAGGTTGSTTTAGGATPAQQVAKANGFDWTAAAIGAGTALGIVLVVGAAGVTVRGRRRVALSS